MVSLFKIEKVLYNFIDTNACLKLLRSNLDVLIWLISRQILKRSFNNYHNYFPVFSINRTVYGTFFHILILHVYSIFKTQIKCDDIRFLSINILLSGA